MIETIITMVCGFVLPVVVFYYFGSAMVEKKIKLEYFPEHDAWFGVSEEPEIKKPLKRKLDI